jgi:uncharacterized membrane protein
MAWFKWEPFTPEEEHRVLHAISEAELNTSGEIRVHIDKWCKTDPVFKACNVFDELEMGKTDGRNAVLFYVAKKEKKFAVIGDVGIDQVVPDDFWNSTKNIMTRSFAKGDIVGGVCEGIHEVGAQLKKYFPYESDDTNELPDEISYG